jgi:predicted MFS family arabinose efflux permease
MWNAFRAILSNATLGVATITLFCLGFTYASTVPYHSLIGVDQLGMSAGHFSVLLLAMAITGMVGSFILGHFSDEVENRKFLILVVLAFGAIGFGAFAILPSIWSFLICLLLFYPISNSAYGQLFAVIRTETNALGSKDGPATNSVVRSIYAASWIIVPGLVGLFIATRKNVSDSFAVAAAAFTLCFLIYAAFGSNEKNKNLGQSTAWAGFKTALGLVGSRAILLRVLALALIATSYSANATLLPLFITHLPHAGTTDVGVLAGLVAGLEIPFMLIGGYFSRNIALWKVIVAAGLVHVAYLLGLGFVNSLWQIYALAVLNAAGAAILLSQHLSYMQDLMPDRPGLGSSLQSISSLLYKATGALVFASSGLIGFSGAAWFGAIIAVFGCALLYVLDHKKEA